MNEQIILAQKKFIDNSIFLENYEKVDRIVNNEPHSAKKVKKTVKDIREAAKFLLSTEEGVLYFSRLLDDENLVVASSAAQYLYPLYPAKCVDVIKRYASSLQDNLDRHRIECLLDGYVSGNVIFMDFFKKLYGVDDLSVLNREN